MGTSTLDTGRAAVAVTLGDPRGIGTEVAFAAARRLLEEDPRVRLVLVGHSEPGATGLPAPDCDQVDVGPWDGSPEGAGRVSSRAIEVAVEMASAGDVGAVVTAPVHKPALHLAGWKVPGQTEMLQQLTGATTVGMLMAAESTHLGGALRVLLATTHLALRDVPAAVTEDLLVTQTALLDASLRTDWGINAPRSALCALNPHASDDGLFGDEEARIMAPAVARLTAAGAAVTGPLPADTVFGRALNGEFDAVVAPYHDVGMAAFKTAAFGSGVNVTLGLPFIRTSPDHGTAFDIARDHGRADPSSMLAALRLARKLALRRFGGSAGSPS